MDSYSDDVDIYDPINRKRRRGVIEKRRRDRINNSLFELRRLVPMAAEKESSTKIEKAEILQMTVDYLKHFQRPDDVNSQYVEKHKVSGFHECALEMSRYLVNVEGFDLNHPLRLRLLSHLQTFADENYCLPTSETQVPQNEFIPSSSSSASSVSSPQKYESSCFQTPVKHQQPYTHQQQPQPQGTQFLNNSAFVQINITAASNKTPSNEMDNKHWHSYSEPNNTTFIPASYEFTQNDFNKKNAENFKYFNQTQYWNPMQQQIPASNTNNKTHFAITG